MRGTVFCGFVCVLCVCLRGLENDETEEIEGMILVILGLERNIKERI